MTEMSAPPHSELAAAEAAPVRARAAVRDAQKLLANGPDEAARAAAAATLADCEAISFGWVATVVALRAVTARAQAGPPAPADKYGI